MTKPFSPRELFARVEAVLACDDAESSPASLYAQAVSH
jgi:DNA-binding response OmpR family regulator